MKLGIILRILALLGLTPTLCRGTLFTEDGTIGPGYDGPVSLGSFATVTVTGGNLYDVRIQDYGTLDFMGGTLHGGRHGIEVVNRGTMNLLGSSLTGIRLRDSATFNIEGGLFQGQMEADGSSIININDGQVQDGDLEAMEYTIINIYGGSTTWSSAHLRNYSTLNVYGGLWEGNTGVSDYSTLNIYGGVWDGGLSLNEFATVNIYGGDIAFGWLGIDFGGSATTNVCYSSIIYDTRLGIVSGYHLLDGSEFMLNQFTWAEINQMNFIPEPATLLMLALGAILLRTRK